MSAFLKTALPSFLLVLLCVATDGRLYSVPSPSEDSDHTPVVVPAPDSRLHILLFETDWEEVPDIQLTKQIDRAGISYSVFGAGAKFEGYGTKWGLALSALADVPPDALVVISDSRDVILNIHNNDKDHGRRTIEEFSLAYRALTLNKPGAVVMSAEGQCCVSALTHAKPGSYFHANGTRAERACASGEEGCKWAGDSRKVPWEHMMQELAKDIQGEYVRDSYLNAGLVAGRAKDVKQLIKLADMEAFEDDQAVFTDLLYTRPDLLVLDYAQEMFGNMRWTLGMAGGGCNVAPDKSKPTAGLVHTETQTVPLFLHTPGKFLECLDSLSGSLEITALLSDSKQSQRFLRRKTQEQRRTNYFNYFNYGSSSNYGRGETYEVTANTSAFGLALPYDIKLEDIMSPNGTTVEGITITVHRQISVVNGTRRTDELIGDMRGLFFHVRGDTVSIHDSDVVMATGPIPGQNFRGKVKIAKGNVERVTNEVKVKPRGGLARKYDVGIEIGTKGIGRDDIQATTVTIMGLTVKDVVGEMAILVRRIGERGQDRTRRNFRKNNSAMIAIIAPN